MISSIFSSIATVWFRGTIFSANKETMILSKCTIKSLLLVIAFEENAFEVTQSQS